MTSQDILDFALDGIMKCLLEKDVNKCRSMLSKLNTDIIQKELNMRRGALVKILQYQKELNEKYPTEITQGKE